MTKGGLWVLLGRTLRFGVLHIIIDTSSKDEISDADFMAQVRDGDVESVKIDNTNGDITGELSSGAEFSTTGPLDGGIPDSDLTVLREQDVKVEYDTPQASFFASLLPFLIPVGIFIA